MERLRRRGLSGETHFSLVLSPTPTLFPTRRGQIVWKLFEEAARYLQPDFNLSKLRSGNLVNLPLLTPSHGACPSAPDRPLKPCNQLASRYLEGNRSYFGNPRSSLSKERLKEQRRREGLWRKGVDGEMTTWKSRVLDVSREIRKKLGYKCKNDAKTRCTTGKPTPGQSARVHEY